VLILSSSAAAAAVAGVVVATIIRMIKQATRVKKLTSCHMFLLCVVKKVL
jgi:hypothetical protein